MKKHLTALVALLILILGLQCGKEGDTPAPPAFTISNLQYNPGTVTIKAQQPSFPVSGTLEYANAQKGVTQLRMQTSAGADLTVPVQGVTQASGVVIGNFEIAMPTKPGAYTFQLWLVDGDSRSSNKLSGSVDMTVSDAATTWEVISQQHELHKVIWANNQYIAVGEDGKILSSPNGGTWTPYNSNTSQTLYAVCWTGSQYVAVGKNRAVVTSPNGTTWTYRSANQPDVNLYGVAASGSSIVAVGWDVNDNSSEILSSADGITWTHNAFKVTGGELTGVTWANSQYVAVGKAFGYPLILTSPDGNTWTNRSGISDVPGQLAEVVWSGSKYVASGYSAMATSADGITWNLYSNPTFSAAGITWSGNRFVAASLNGIYTSADGVNWTRAFESPYPLRSIAWSGFQYVTVGFISPIIMVSP